MKNKLLVGLILFVIGFYTSLAIKISYIFSGFTMWYEFLDKTGIRIHNYISNIIMIGGVALVLAEVMIMFKKRKKSDITE